MTEPTKYNAKEGEMMGDETFGFCGNIPEKKGRVNPMVRLFGLGPEGEICKNCAHLIGHSHSHTYYKCNLRTITSGPSSDHRVRWSACARFGKRKQEECWHVKVVEPKKRKK